MELIDTSLDEKEVAAIRETLLATPGVRDLHELRTRRMGDRALVDAHVLVDPKISVSEGHYVAETARARVVKTHDALDVMIHIDPEDDSAVKRSLHLPPREVLLAHLEQQLAMPLPLSSRIALHYLDGRVEADIFLAGPASDDSLAKALAAVPGNDPYFGAIRLFHEFAP
jgi:hypothetical protein